MSTHALTKVVGDVLVAMYTHYDGYPSNFGKELYNFLKDITIVNGIGETDKKIANGMGCLAAQLVAHFKDEPGNIYLVPTNSENEEYTYVITLTKSTNKLMVELNNIKASLETFKLMCEDDN